MNYELAKELKEAEFPHKPHPQFFGDCGNCWHMPGLPVVHAPTLEELIEACGEAFIDLRRGGLGWIATAQSGKQYPEMSWLCGDGGAPTEAVARLWLALNPKHGN